MSSNKVATIVYIIIGLAVVGLISQLFTNTVGFLTNIFTMLAFGLVIFGIIYFVFLRKKSPSNNDAKKYKEAVKQSKAKYKNQNSSRSSMNKKTQQSRKKLQKRRASHLRVIDGNKPNQKDRASL